MSSNDSIKKTLIVAFSLCIVCSVIVSTAAVMLKPAQEVNKTLDRKRNILAAAGMLQEGVSVEEQFSQVTPRVVDLRTGRFADDVDPDRYDQRKAVKDPDAQVRGRAVLALRVAASNPQVKAALEGAASDPDPEVQKKAKQVLGAK